MKPLPHTSLAQLTEQSRLGREAWAAGDIKSAEKHFLEAWEAIPNPKAEFDYSQSVASGLVIFYRDTKQYAEAKNWITKTRNLYSPTGQEYIDFLAATVEFDAGSFDVAFETFDAQYKKYGQRPFSGENNRYIDFYKTRVRSAK